MRVSSEQYPVFVISCQVQQYFIFLYLYIFFLPSSFFPPFLLTLFRPSSFSLITTHYIFLVSWKATLRCRSREVERETRMRKRESKMKRGRWEKKGKKVSGRKWGWRGKEDIASFSIFTFLSLLLPSFFFCLFLFFSLYFICTLLLFFSSFIFIHKIHTIKKGKEMNEWLLYEDYIRRLVGINWCICLLYKWIFHYLYLECNK